MDHSDFAVHAPLLWTIGYVVVALVIGMLAWRMASEQFSGVRVQLARAILILGIVGAVGFSLSKARPPVRVSGTTLELTWPLVVASKSYQVTDLRFFDVQNLEVGSGVKSDLKKYLLMSFNDGGYIEVSMDLDNASRLLSYLRRHGLSEGMPMDGSFQRPY